MLHTSVNIQDEVVDNGVRSREVLVKAKMVVDDVICDMKVDCLL